MGHDVKDEKEPRQPPGLMAAFAVFQGLQPKGTALTIVFFLHPFHPLFMKYCDSSRNSYIIT